MRFELFMKIKLFICAQLIARPTQVFKCCHSFFCNNHSRLHKSTASFQPHAFLNMDRCIFFVAFSSMATTRMFYQHKVVNSSLSLIEHRLIVRKQFKYLAFKCWLAEGLCELYHTTWSTANVVQSSKIII